MNKQATESGPYIAIPWGKRFAVLLIKHVEQADGETRVIAELIGRGYHSRESAVSTCDHWNAADAKAAGK